MAGIVLVLGLLSASRSHQKSENESEGEGWRCVFMASTRSPPSSASRSHKESESESEGGVLFLHEL